MAIPLAVLYCTSSEPRGGPVSRALERAGFSPSLHCVSSRDELSQHIAGAEWQLIMADPTWAGASGWEALEMARQSVPRVPRLLCLDTLDESLMSQAADAARPELATCAPLPLIGPLVSLLLERGQLQQRILQLEDELFRTRRLDAVGTFASSLTHELNNLLTPMLLASEVLLDLSRDPGHRELLATLLDGSRRAAAAVKQLQDFLRGEPAVLERVRPADLVDELGRLWQIVLPKTIQRRVAVDAHLPAIQADPAALMQVLLSLTANALEAMPTGGSLTLKGEVVECDALEASSVPGASAGRYVRFELFDTGEGMTSDILARAGEPFFSTKDSRRNLGLGLAASRQLLARQGGGMHIESRPGEGTRVMVYLPVADG